MISVKYRDKDRENFMQMKEKSKPFIYRCFLLECLNSEGVYPVYFSAFIKIYKMEDDKE